MDDIRLYVSMIASQLIYGYARSDIPSEARNFLMDRVFLSAL